MASSCSKVERSLNSIIRTIAKEETSRILEETIVSVQLELCKLKTPESDSPEASAVDQHPYHDIPRVYTFLRMLSHSHEAVIAVIRKEKLNDYSFPIDVTSLRQLQTDIAPNVFEDTFANIQARFLSDHSCMTAKALDGIQNDHRRLLDGNHFFDDVKILGQGSSATVHRVRHRVSLHVFACKRIERSSIRLVQHDRMKDFLREVRVLKRVHHLHVVKLIASYTDETAFSLILLPVANDTLESLLDRVSLGLTTSTISGRDASTLRQGFGCLLSTIAYLQAQNIRHKDIKPLNILLGDEGRLYLCDFGISLDYSDTNDGTTEGRPIGFTKGYCAPEVQNGEPRNSLSEVWSLGRVCFDMIVVLRGQRIQHAKDFIGLNAEEIPTLIQRYLAPLISESDEVSDTMLMHHILQMTAYSKVQRRSASQILQQGPFQDPVGCSRLTYIGGCCAASCLDQDHKRKGKSPVAYQSSTRPSIDSSSASTEDVDSNPAERNFNSLLRVSEDFINSDELSELEGDGPSQSILSDRSHGDAPGACSEYGIAVQRRSEISDQAPLRAPTQVEDQGSGSTSLSTPSARRCTSHSSSSMEAPSSVQTSPPNESPSILQNHPLGCLCVARRQKTGFIEQQILYIPFASATARSPARSTVKDDKCTSIGNTLRIHESYLQGNSATSGVWAKTRRMVISHRPTSGDSQNCMSIWLPLGDIRYVCHDTAVTLRWSDCDQTEETRLGDYDLIYSRTYQPENPNNEISFIFEDEQTTLRFLHIVTHAVPDPSPQWHKAGLPDIQEIRSIRARQMPAHSIVHVSRWEGNETVSKMFIQWQDPIFDIHAHCRAPTAERVLSTRFCGHVSTPNYISNITNKPSDDTAMVAECLATELVFSEYKLELPLSSNTDDVGLPIGLRNELAFLTGWTIQFFASEVKVTGPGRLGKNYGYSDIFLWENHRTDNLQIRAARDPVFAFRQTGPRRDYLWRTGAITKRSQPTYRNSVVNITIFGKSCGDLLDAKSMTTAMEADLPQNNRDNPEQKPRRRTGKQKKIHEEDGFRLHFDNHEDYTRFFSCFDKLLETVTSMRN